MSEDNQETMTASITTAVLDAIDTRDRQVSDRLEKEKAAELTIERAAKRFLSIRDIVMAVGFFIALIGGATVSFTQLREKPSKAEVSTAIDAKVNPLEQRVGPMEKTVKTMGANMERVQKLQEMQMQHAEWRADVADCRARSSCKRAPSEPQSLKDKKRELMTNQ